MPQQDRTAPWLLPEPRQPDPSLRSEALSPHPTPIQDTGALGAYLKTTRGRPNVPIKTPYHSTWLDNRKACSVLGWRPTYDLARLTDAAFDYVRAPDDPRKTWYPG